MRHNEHDIKAPDGYLLGGLRLVRSDGTILFQRGYWQAPKEWAGQKVWVHIQTGFAWHDPEYLAAAPPGERIFKALHDQTAVDCDRTKRPDAKPTFRSPQIKAWMARNQLKDSK